MSQDFYIVKDTTRFVSNTVVQASPKIYCEEFVKTGNIIAGFEKFMIFKFQPETINYRKPISPFCYERERSGSNFPVRDIDTSVTKTESKKLILSDEDKKIKKLLDKYLK